MFAGFMVSNFHFLSNSLFALVCLLMGTSFLSFHIPRKEGLHNYRISLKVLSSAYFAIGLLTLSVLVFKLADNSREYFTFISILISSTQALLFAFTLITLINPTFVKLKNIIRHTVPYAVFLALYTTSVLIYGEPQLTSISEVLDHAHNPTLWIRLIFLAYYLFQLIYYTHLFLREVRNYDNELLNYFSDVYQLKLGWVRIAFYSALLVGTIALISSFLPMRYDWIVTIIYSLFYFGFAQEYIKYNKVFSIIEPAITPAMQEEAKINNKIKTKTDWQNYKQQIFVNKYYRETGITIEDLALKLQIGRTTLSNFINREEGINFNTWINRMRIEDAKQLLIDNPDYSIVIVSEMVGYTEQANFSRQFKLITGESPLVWRKKSAS
ncbi:MAG TPA: helix-turn-helix domain-containing protein [Tenuifilaceae bacterium]|nr:helix-turn-helix domain-containing protein [Tenuifilaceae bacterium]HPN21933.1 helix-turn-helix domain-containing protein [Tenuifilaceae bacterium]